MINNHIDHSLCNYYYIFHYFHLIIIWVLKNYIKHIHYSYMYNVHRKHAMNVLHFIETILIHPWMWRQIEGPPNVSVFCYWRDRRLECSNIFTWESRTRARETFATICCSYTPTRRLRRHVSKALKIQSSQE